MLPTGLNSATKRGVGNDNKYINWRQGGSDYNYMAAQFSLVKLTDITAETTTTTAGTG